MSQDARKAAALIEERAPGRSPKIGLVLGSGLGGLGDQVEDAVSFSFAELPGFPEPTVEGHAGRLILGTLAGVEVACLQGRVHLYEGHHANSVQPLIRTLKLLGCETLVLTNAAGALDLDAKPGQLMLITDHINGQGTSPLLGKNDDSFGPRFPAMTGAYSKALQERIKSVAATQGVTLREGTYIALLGPTFETPAEIRMCQAMGANAVGMSTVPEVIVARHCGMECAAVSVLTNMGAGLSDEELSHDQTLEFAHKASATLQELIKGFIGTFA
ncbi:MAG: purine-nucleoside phosphorylase [Nannocystaceae bacterium]|nr:purine-nucleoside phosphorylase [Nannocystaceae bacterium]